MEIKISKHVRIVCDLHVGQVVRLDGYGYKFQNKKFKIEEIKRSANCGSGFLVKIDGYENPLDSDWIDVVSDGAILEKNKK